MLHLFALVRFPHLYNSPMKIELAFLIAILAGMLIGLFGTQYVKLLIQAELRRPQWIHISLEHDTDYPSMTVSTVTATERELLNHILLRHPEFKELVTMYAESDTAIKKLMDDIND